jgi:hypothetical protein
MAIQLSTNIVSQVDVARILRELKNLDDFFIAAKTRTTGSPMQLPRLTRLLDLLHISFAAEPSTQALEKILIWFRTNIHAQALLQVGLQPTIAAGCVLRTNNKVFDMSLRENLSKQKPFLVQLIDSAVKGR